MRKQNGRKAKRICVTNFFIIHFFWNSLCYALLLFLHISASKPGKFLHCEYFMIAQMSTSTKFPISASGSPSLFQCIQYREHEEEKKYFLKSLTQARLETSETIINVLTRWTRISFIKTFKRCSSFSRKIAIERLIQRVPKLFLLVSPIVSYCTKSHEWCVSSACDGKSCAWKIVIGARTGSEGEILNSSQGFTHLRF